MGRSLARTRGAQFFSYLLFIGARIRLLYAFAFGGEPWPFAFVRTARRKFPRRKQRRARTISIVRNARRGLKSPQGRATFLPSPVLPPARSRGGSPPVRQATWVKFCRRCTRSLRSASFRRWCSCSLQICATPPRFRFQSPHTLLIRQIMARAGMVALITSPQFFRERQSPDWRI